MLKYNSLEPALSSTWWWWWWRWRPWQQWRWQLLLLSIHCIGGIREKEIRDTQRDHVLTGEELKTSWLFLLYPCNQSRSMNCLRYPPWILVNDRISGGVREGYSWPKIVRIIQGSGLLGSGLPRDNRIALNTVWILAA